jgi:hypothetical protein
VERPTPLYDAQATVESFLATHPGALRRARSAIGLIAVGALAAILIVLSVDAVLRGPWLDEFWTLDLSDTRKGIGVLIRDGWLHDTHPPVFNLWATFLTFIGVTSIPVARLASNLPAAGLMVFAALNFSRRTPEKAGFNAAMLLLTLSLPQSVETFGNYRSYFWQIAALATLTLVARHVALTEVELDTRKESDLAVVAVLATAASVALHYVSGLFGGLLAGGVALCALARGHRRWAILVLATAATSSLFVIAVALVQALNWAVDLDHSWIQAEGLAALSVPFALAVGTICHNLAPLAGLWTGRRHWTLTEGVFIAMMAGVLVAGIALVLAINAYRPIVVARYIFPVSVLVCAIMAALAVKFARDWRLFGLLALVSVAVVAVPLVRHGAPPQWQEGARTIARIVADCPTTEVYAASGWMLGPGAESRTARREDPVFERAYRVLADQCGYTVHFIGQDGVAHAVLGQCPVLLWYEHTPNDAEYDPASALAAAGLKGLEEARLSAIRSTTGFVIRADRP